MKKFQRIKEKIFAWHLESPLVRLLEKWLLGDCDSIFLKELSHILRGNEVVLDLGAGTGRFSLAIAKTLKTGKVLCLDRSEPMLQKLEQKAKNMGLRDKIQILKQDASCLELENASVDLVVSNNMLHEVPNPEAILKEMLRVLKPDGWLVITDFRKTPLSQFICHSHMKEAHGPFEVHELETLFDKLRLRNRKVYPIRNWVIAIGKK